MRVYSFAKEAGKSIDAFGSQQLYMSRILTEAVAPHVGCVHLGVNGLVGWHQASVLPCIGTRASDMRHARRQD